MTTLGGSPANGGPPVVFPDMSTDASQEVTATISAVIIRADGTVEDLGVLDADITVNPATAELRKDPS